MFCKKCGSSIGENEHYCPVCGAKVEADPTDIFAQQYSTAQKETPAYYKTTMVLGILSTIFSALNYFGIPFVHIVGIILGATALQYAKRDKESYGTNNSTGKILAIIGLVLGLVAVAFGVYYSVVYGV